jgi:hypothetical protein
MVSAGDHEIPFVPAHPLEPIDVEEVEGGV